MQIQCRMYCVNTEKLSYFTQSNIIYNRNEIQTDRIFLYLMDVICDNERQK